MRHNNSYKEENQDSCDDTEGRQGPNALGRTSVVGRGNGRPHRDV